MGIVELVSLATALCTLLSLFSGQHLYLELLSHFKFQYLLISIFSALVYGAWKRYWLAIIFMALASVNLLFVTPLYWPPQGQKNDGAEDAVVRILHSNVNSTNRDYQKLLGLIKANNPDIIVLQEINVHWQKAMAALQDNYPHYFSHPREDNFGLGVWSRLPVTEANWLDFGKVGLPSLQFNITLKNQDISIIATHPLPPINIQYYQARNKHLEALAQTVKKMSVPFVIVGDLNVSPWSSNYQSLTKNSGITNARQGNGLVLTWPTFMPLLAIPIDHILLSKELGAQDFVRGENIGSDHWPVMAKIAFK